jgi:hypothetical protein
VTQRPHYLTLLHEELGKAQAFMPDFHERKKGEFDLSTERLSTERQDYQDYYYQDREDIPVLRYSND